jgi:hypothetical protein
MAMGIEVGALMESLGTNHQGSFTELSSRDPLNE